MDIRNTIHTQESFLRMLSEFYKSHGKLSLLVDDNGIGRAEGYIRGFTPDRAAVELEDGSIIEVKKIIAINGIFLSDYSEC